MDQKDKKQETRAINVPVVWKSQSDLPTLYINQLSVTHAAGEFYLTFGEADVPVFGPDSSPPEIIEIIPKAKIVIMPENMEKIIKALQTNLEHYKKSKRPILPSKNSHKTRRSK